MTRTIVATLAAGLMLSAASPTMAASDKAAVQQVLRTMLEKVNTGDLAGALALSTPTGSVIDEFAPYAWSDSGHWGQDFGSYLGQNGITDDVTTLRKFRHVNVDGGHAYVVVTVLNTYKVNGKPRREPGTEVYTLEKGAAGWQFNSYIWFSKNGVDTGTDASAIDAVVRDFADGKTGPATTLTAITDEFAPYFWHGPNAAADWFSDLQKSSAHDHDTDFVIAPGKASQLNINSDKAYAVYPTVLTFKHRGKPMTEHGAFAMAFDKSSGNWRMTSWAWATD